MDGPALLQTGPESFALVLDGGEQRALTLPTAARRELGLHGIPPLTVATASVQLLTEHGRVPAAGADLVSELARQPGGLEELRSRLG